MSYKKNKKYEFFDVTADIGFLAYGDTLEEAFENSSLAMFNIISNTSNIEATNKFNIKIESEDLISLLYDYLEELLFLSDVNLILFSEFNVSINETGNNEKTYALNATVKGEPINWDKHERGSEVKAITFHMMDVALEDKHYKTRVILDL